jgi:hypothetical protein
MNEPTVISDGVAGPGPGAGCGSAQAPAEAPAPDGGLVAPLWHTTVAVAILLALAGAGSGPDLVPVYNWPR